MIPTGQNRLTQQQSQQVRLYRARHANRRSDRPRKNSSDEDEPVVLIEPEDYYQKLVQRFKPVTIVDKFKVPYVSELCKIYFCCALNSRRVGSGKKVMDFGMSEIDLISLIKVNFDIAPGILRDVIPTDWEDEIQRLKGILNAFTRRVRISDDPWPAWRQYVDGSMDQIRQQLQQNMQGREGQIQMSPPSEEIDLLNSFRASTLFGVERDALWNKIRGWRPPKELHNVGQRLTISINQARNCEKCQSRLTRFDTNMGIKICGNMACSQSVQRQIYDRLFVPNLVHGTRMTGVALDKKSAEQWESYRTMWCDEEENNIREVVSQDFIFDNRISWRGRLALRDFDTEIAMITPEQCNALQNALKNERYLGLTIKPVPGWQNEQNLGVFATHFIMPNTIVCVYSGEMFASDELRFWKDGSSRVKFVYVGAHQLILSPQRRANVGRYLNGSKTKRTANVRVAWVLLKISDADDGVEPVLVMISTKAIHPNQQLVWCYGGEFNRDHNLTF